VPQAETLDDILRETADAKLDVVLELVVDDDEVIRRLSGRRTCRTCNHIWHVDFDPPARPASATSTAASSTSATTTRPRRSPTGSTVYAEQTAPLVAYYARRGVLVGIDATGPVDDITQRAIDALRPFSGRAAGEA
jgi:adenylate kinase